jgi:hypothetical protein
LLSAADYWLELPLQLRIAALVAIGAAAVATAVMLGVQSVRRWRRQATAVAIERVFPQLGQRIRTTVQYGPLSDEQATEAGVASTLVVALEDDTIQRAQPLPLDAVVPWKSLALASLLAAVVGFGLAGASAFDWEWRNAAQRAFLADEPYTKIAVDPGDATLKEGESLTIHVAVEGRTGKELAFRTRPGDGENDDWEEAALASADAEQVSETRWEYTIPLERVRRPLEYRLQAGMAETDIYRVEVLYPLKITRITSTLTSPEYTGLEEQVSESGNIRGLVGSQVALQIELDRPPQTAWLELAEMSRRAGEPAAEKLPVTIEGNKLTAAFELTTDQTYSVVAQAADGMELPENRYRIRVRQDEPPQVWFESPAEALEVHSLAEILMRIRVSDDFGLSRAGIVFEINNEEEYPLLTEDFAAAAEELQTTGKLSPQTRASLEKVLPLEHFALTQRDSVMYYAFAEDTRPDTPQRTESDLRFIDIRPFRRLYRLIDLDGEPMQQGPGLKTLAELIARQRYALNRTIQLSRKFERTGKADLAGVDSLLKFQAELAKSTRELAEGLEARGVDDTELLYQAETAMLGAADSLSAGNYETATLQERDALKYLIEGRNRLEILIRKNPDRNLLAQLRQFDRMQQQKLRRPKTDEEEAREVVERLEELAEREQFIYEALAGIIMPGQRSQEGESGSGAASKKPQPPRENPEGDGEMPKRKESEDAENFEEIASADNAGSTGESAQAGETKDEAGEAKEADLAGAEAEGDEGEQAGAMSREELLDRQLDVALESREIETILNRLNGVSDLAKERIAAAAASAEEAAEKLGAGELPDAQQSARSAGRQFRELSEQVAALVAQEQSQRVAAAQQMAAELARQQRDFSDRLAQSNQREGAGEQSGDASENPMPGLGEMAEQIAERAETLEDVLVAAGGSTEPQDQESAQRVQALVGSLKLDELTERLQNLPSQVQGGQEEDAQAVTGDGAERMEAAAQQLAVLHRSIVAPRVEELAQVEQQLTALDEELDRLEAPSQITAWHVEANELLDALDEGAVSEELREQFLEEMRKAGWTPELRRGGWSWVRVEGGYYAAPAPYHVAIRRIVSDVRDRMQELLLADQTFSQDEPIPPQYEELVDRFYQVLAGAKRENPPAPANSTEELRSP